MLAFETVADYEKAIDYLVKLENTEGCFKKWDEALDFTSMRKSCDNKNINIENIPVSTTILSSVLTEKGQLMIENKVLTIDAINENVNVYDNTTKSNLNLSFDDDVLNLAFDRDNNDLSVKESFDNCTECKQKGYCAWNDEPNSIGYMGVNGVTYSFQSRYRKWGIYYELSAHIDVPNGSGADAIVTITQYSYWTWNNDAGEVKAGVSKSGDGNTLEWKFYGRTYRLTNYALYLNFKVTSGNLSDDCDIINLCE